jgi:uncharacterized protein
LGQKLYRTAFPHQRIPTCLTTPPAAHRSLLPERTAAAPCYAERHFGGEGVFKILLLLAIGFVVLALFRAYQRSLGQPPSSAREKTVEDMVKCAHCGVNLPRSEAIYSGGNFFCTPEHRQLGKK